MLHRTVRLKQLENEICALLGYYATCSVDTNIPEERRYPLLRGGSLKPRPENG